ncbi:MAG: hypothetical protein LBR21_03540 [Propionibacteriaceae bacterium]|jgi:Flp pilus assembly pilin Flp|nr:hypothetical protein [Propionibacteriaceae bacterium]
MGTSAKLFISGIRPQLLSPAVVIPPTPLHARQRWEFVRGESGQSTVEYLGILCAVVVVVAAVLSLAPGIGESVGGAIQSVIEQITGKAPGLTTAGAGSGGGTVPSPS